MNHLKRQFFHMVTHVFDNSNLSQEIFAIETWRAVICSLGHHILTILSTLWRPGLRRLRSDLLHPKFGSQKSALRDQKAITSLRLNIFQQSKVC